ncbi:ABC transporter permease [Flavobacterium aquicola]|uniref:Putative ABC transport system permease protein n=1 Tax=Flavobacterium aquicola TaxID=1682742 RepID=A0A3E0EIU4_9FLAO|nr:ABC transporter permease [Flavobacterium aquicola]REG98101.1 putative ABC transport system permease protein [Flavobacterium aquicola]
MIKNWTTIFIYHIKNNKLFTALNILGLSIGIAGLIFAILYWNDEQSYNDWNPGKDTVFQVLVDIGEERVWTNAPVTFEPLLKDDANIEKMMYCENWYESPLYKYNGKKIIIEKLFNSQNNFFDFFPFEFVKGNPKTALQNENSIAMKEETAALFFGTENPIGKQIQYEDQFLTVTAVYKITQNSSIAPDAVVNNMKPRIDRDKTSWGNFNNGWYIKLKDPSKAGEISKKLTSIYYQNKTIKDAKAEGITPKEFESKYGKFNFFLEPLSISRLHTQGQGSPEGKGNYQFLLIMSGLSILILVLSIVNYINLATANAIRRAKEVGVRKIVGASKTEIIKQFLFETVITVLSSILLALAIVELSLPYYNEFLDKTLIIYGNQFYLQIILIFIITVIFAGVFPAIYVSNFETLKVLKGNFGRNKSGVWLRNGMLILQFSIASFFIIGSYIVYEQVHYLSTKSLGFSGSQVLEIFYFKPEAVFKAKNPEQLIFDRYTTIKNELSKIKGVQQVTTGAFRFGGGNDSSSGFSYKGNNIQGQNLAVDFGMLEMMKIEMAQGRYLNPKIASDTINSMMVNEAALKIMNEKNPIGKIVDWNDHKLKIIGVVKDFSLFSPQGKVPPMVFFHFKTVDWMIGNINHIYVKLEAENTEQTIGAIEKFWTAKVDSDYPFHYDFIDKSYMRTYKTYVKQKNLFSLLNVIVIMIALFGLFALASYSIERRMKEIAIRKTLGAETNALLKELSKQYIIFSLIGFLIALFPVYYLLNRWLENFANRIDISIYPFIIGFAALLSLTLLVVLSKAYQATRVDVLKYLKYE